MIFSGIVKRKPFGQGVCLLLVLGLIAGCAGVPRTGPEDASRISTPPPPSGPPMYKGKVVNVQKFLPVRSDPSLSATEMGRLKPGDTLTIKEEQGEWYSIAAPDENAPSFQGWVMQKYVEKGELIAPPPPPPAAQQPSDEQKDVSGMKTKTAVQGAVIGTLAGAAIGALAGLATGDSRNVVKGALIGAGAGLATGLVAGIYVANKKEDYANNEAYLDACINEARQYNEIAAKANDDLSTQIRLTEQNIDQLRTRTRNAALRRQQASQNVETLKQAAGTSDKNIAALEGEISAQEKALKETANDKTGRSAALESEVGKLRLQLAEMKTKRDRLNSLNAELSKMAV